MPVADHRPTDRYGMPTPASERFPIAEGLGVFVGVAAWDLLAEGRLDAPKALLIAVACSLVWYGVRCWRARRPPER